MVTKQAKQKRDPVKNQFAQPGRVSARRRPSRPPRLRSFSAKPTGPRLYRSAKDDYNSAYFQFFVPPPGFITYTNSRSEWAVYVALSKVFGLPRDPRQGPYTGWPGLWTYQSPMEGGRAARGGQVVDFVVHGTGTGNGDVFIRVQTERYHVFTGAAKHAMDQLLLTRLARFGRVADIYEQSFLADPSGQAVVIEVKRAIFGGRTSSPLSSGTARRVKV